MKKNLGKLIFLLFILIQTTIEATPLATYKLYASKKSAYTKEPIEITFEAHQKDYSNVMFFFVKPIESDNYKITLLSKTTKENAYHNYTAIFTFILFPLKAKQISVDFEFHVKTSSDQAVARAYVADHDEGRGIDGDFSNIAVKPISLNIKELPSHADLVGDFKLTSEIDKEQITQYDNINLHYRLYGTGYDENLVFLKDLKNTDIFSDVQVKPSKLTKEGYKIDKDYTYAISAKEDFTIPSVSLQAYSPTTKQFYTLKTEPYKIKVDKIDLDNILDMQESPKQESIISLNSFKEFFIYIFIFLSGYLVAKLTKKEMFVFNKHKKYQDIRESSTPKELILILLNKYKNRDNEKYIKELEGILHEKKSTKFYEIKKSILKEFT